MSLIKEYSLTTPLNEGEIKEIIGLSDSKTKAGRLFEQWAKDIKEMREERRENESSTDTRFMVESIRNLASKTFLTEAQLMHIVDKNEQLDFKDINESVLVDLVKRELDGFSGYDRINESKRFAPRLGERLKRGLKESKSRLDESTINLGGDEVEVPKGTKFISIDEEVVAWSKEPENAGGRGGYKWVGSGKLGVIGKGWTGFEDIAWDIHKEADKKGTYDAEERIKRDYLFTLKDFIRLDAGEYLTTLNEADLTVRLNGKEVEVPEGTEFISVDGKVTAWKSLPKFNTRKSEFTGKKIAVLGDGVEDFETLIDDKREDEEMEGSEIGEYFEENFIFSIKELKKNNNLDKLILDDLNEAKSDIHNPHKTHGDINTIIFGQDDRIDLPVGYTHIAVDFDGTVNAYTNRPVLGEEGWEGEGPIRIGRVEWDDYKLQSGSNDINLLRNEKRAKMLGSVISVHDKINIGSQLERANSFLQWKSDFQVSDSIVNESVMDMPSVQVPQMNRFLAVPAHML